jgi:hypothetical protein
LVQRARDHRAHHPEDAVKRTVSYLEVARERSSVFWKHARTSITGVNPSRESTLERALEAIVRRAYETGYLNACTSGPSADAAAIETAQTIAVRRAKRRKPNAQRNRGARV